MRIGSYLRRRRHTWFFRFRWPRALAACRVSGELVLSLRTTDYRLALRRARLLRCQVEELMSKFTPTMSRPEIEGLVRNWVDACLWDQELQLAETGGFVCYQAHELEGIDREIAAEMKDLVRATRPSLRATRKSGCGRP